MTGLALTEQERPSVHRPPVRLARSEFSSIGDECVADRNGSAPTTPQVGLLADKDAGL